MIFLVLLRRGRFVSGQTGAHPPRWSSPARALIAGALAVSVAGCEVGRPAGPAAAVYGLVEDAMLRQPATGVRVTVAGRAMVTGASGLFFFEDLPRGEHTVTASSERHETVEVVVDGSASRELRLRLNRTVAWPENFRLREAVVGSRVEILLNHPVDGNSLPERLSVVPLPGGSPACIGERSDRIGFSRRSYELACEGGSESFAVEFVDGHAGVMVQFVCSVRGECREEG